MRGQGIDCGPPRCDGAFPRQANGVRRPCGASGARDDSAAPRGSRPPGRILEGWAEVPIPFPVK